MTASPILSCRGVRKAFGGLQALDGVDFDLPEGEIRGLVGPNGSGKSTLINVLTGFLPLDSGEVTVGGRRVEALPTHRISELGVARTYQIPRPFGTLSVLQNVQAAAYFGNADRRPDDVVAEAQRWIAFTGLEDVTDHKPDELTLHQRKLLELARALMVEPRMVLLDEPMAGINPTLGRRLLQHMEELRTEQGVTFLFVEHDMEVVMNHSDRVIVMALGRVIADGSPDQVRSDPAVIDAYLGGGDDSG
jgi:ABC-type branched-subunit amino acid transport system ATPase component